MTTARSIGVGLISVGWMGKLHSRAYTNLPIVYPELGIRPRLVQAADTAEDRIDYARDVLGYASGTTDYREVLANPEVDVVSICAPNFLHAEIGKAAAQAGKAFWIEKPAGRSAQETQEIADAAAAAGVISAVGFNYRNAPAIEYARSLVAGGKLGRITNIRGAFFADYSSEPKGALSWRFIRDLAGSGVLGDLMGHLADLAHYVVGPVARVSAVTSTVYTERPKLPMGQGTHFAVVEDGEMLPVENEDYAALLVAFGGDAAGAVGTLEASRVSVGPRAQYSLEVYGTEGSLLWDFERMNELQLALGRSGPHVGYTRIMAGPDFGDFGRFQPGAGTSMGYDDLKVIEARKFLQAYLGEDSAHADIRDALAANRVVSAAETSAASGTWEEVAPVEGTTAARRAAGGAAETTERHDDASDAGAGGAADHGAGPAREAGGTADA
ncbi:Gfo/Idh/MocA family oxidoreductase [Sediminivirga luteola]|uniref:Gfo/Idh/MocA family protein n=1 Tax=Sediminivirga luteola TaxID=1774748 RepID=UPI0030D82D94